MQAQCALDQQRQVCTDAHVGSPTGRHMPIENESLARKSARCRAVAQRQAALAGNPAGFEVGEQIGVHKFHSYVGGNPSGLYVYLQCNCGNVFAYKRSNLSQLRSTKKNVRYCRNCVPNRKGGDR